MPVEERLDLGVGPAVETMSNGSTLRSGMSKLTYRKPIPWRDATGLRPARRHVRVAFGLCRPNSFSPNPQDLCDPQARDTEYRGQRATVLALFHAIHCTL